MGLNSNSRSYVVGVSPDSASSPRQAVDRVTGPSSFNGGDNPETLTGALVHGPSANGAFVDRRSAAQNTGISLLNNSPLSLLVTALRSRGLKIEDCIGLRPRSRLSTTINVAQAAQEDVASGGSAASAA